MLPHLRIRDRPGVRRLAALVAVACVVAGGAAPQVRAQNADVTVRVESGGVPVEVEIILQVK